MIVLSYVSAEKLPLVFVNVDFLVVFVSAILIWLSSEVIGGRIVPSLRRHGDKVEQRQKGLNVIPWKGWVVFFAVSINVASLRVALLSSWAFFSGIMTLLIGIAVRQ